MKKTIPLGSVLRTSILVFGFLIAAKILNFFKKILIGKLFGVSSVADAFFAASYLPYYLAIFFEGVLFLGFLPLFSQLREEKGEEEANRFATQIALLVFLLTAALVGAAWWLAPGVTGTLVPGFSPSERDLTCSLFRILSGVVIFISLRAFFQALNSYFEHNGWAASSGFVDSLVMIAVTLIVWKALGIHGAAWAAVVGTFTAFVFQALFFFRRHPFRPLGLVWEKAWLGRLFYFLLPMGIIWIFQQVPLVVLNRFGSGMWEGTISALTLSQTLTTVPMGLVSHTVLLAVFPSLAKQASEPTPENVRETFFQTLRGGFLVLIPVGFLLTASARPLAAFFFDGGGISEEGTRRIANSLACFGWATFALYADLFMSQSLIAVRKTFPAILLSGSRAVLTYFFGYFLSTLWDYQGLALSFSLALAVNLYLFFPVFFRNSPFRGQWKALFRYSAKVILAASPILLAGGVANRWSVAEWMSFPKTALLASLVLGFLALTLLYGLLLSWLKVEEIRSVFREFERGGAGKRWWLAEQSE